MKIEKRDYELALISTESSLFQARLTLEREEAEAKLASIEWKRVGKGDASSLTLREPQLAQARAVLAAAEAAYEQSKRNLERTSIIAPFDGRVRKKMVDLGTNLIPGSRLADIYATASFEVRLPIADKDIPFLGIPFSTSSNPIRTLDGLLVLSLSTIFFPMKSISFLHIHPSPASIGFMESSISFP